MALATATITYSLADLTGVPHYQGTRVTATTNIPGNTIADTDGNVVRLGEGKGTINPDGTGTIVVWAPGAGSNPDSWQTYIHVKHRVIQGPSPTHTFGPFTVTADANLADLIAEMPVQPEYASEVFDRLDALEADNGTGEALAELGDRVDGVNDHGNVSGSLTIDPEFGYHIFDATGPTEVTLGTPPGNSVAFKAITGADDVTVDGLADLTLTDDQWATFVYYRSAWHLASAGASGGGTVEPVTDPPTQPGAITVDPTSDGYNLSWVASTVAAGYEVQIDGGTWVDSGANLTHAYTGLSAGSEHSGAVRAYNSVGERSTVRTWGPATTDSPGLHEQLLAYDPVMYARYSQGSAQYYGTEDTGWSQIAGTALTFDGPAIVPGATGSAKFRGGAQVQRASIGTALNDAETLAVVIVAHVPTENYLGWNIKFREETEFGSRANLGVPVGPEAYEGGTPGSTHTFTYTRIAGAGYKLYMDEDVLNTTTWSPWNTAGPDITRILLNGEGGDMDISHIMVTTDALTADDVLAIATAAGTVGNPR